MADYLHDPAVETPAPPPGILVADHFVQPYGYETHRSAGTRDWLITYTLSGQGNYRIGDKIQPCVSGDIAILLPGTPHHYATAENQIWDFMWAHFVPRPYWLGWMRLPEAAKGFVYMHVGDSLVRRRIRLAFERALSDARIGLNAYHEELAMNALEEVLLLAAQSNAKESARVLDYRVEQVLRLLADRISEPISVDALAKEVNLSPSRLAHLFKQQVGDSIMETLLKMRLRQAARLLQFTSRQVSEIASDVGFKSPFYFTRQFTARFGVNPTTYREKTQSQSLRAESDSIFREREE